MTHSLQTAAPVRAPDDTGGPSHWPPLGLTAAQGLAALRGLSGVIWTSEALRIAEAISLLPEAGGEVLLRADQLDRVAAGLSPAPRDGGTATVEVLVGMAAVLALAAGRMADGAALARPFALREAKGGIALRIGGAAGTQAQAAGGAR